MMNLASPFLQQLNREVFTIFYAIPSDVRIFICTGRTDLRKGIDGLTDIIEGDFGLSSKSKSLYIFCGGRADRVKMLFFDGDSYNLAVRRWESLRIQWPKDEGEIWMLDRSIFYDLMRGDKITRDDPLGIQKRRQ